MQHFTYDIRQEDLWEVTPDNREVTAFDRMGRYLGQLIAPEDQGSADRSYFASNVDDIRSLAVGQGFEVTDAAEAEFNLKLPGKIAERIGTTDDLYSVANEETSPGSIVRGSLKKVSQIAQKRAVDAAWWLRFEDTDTYAYNPMVYDPSEQFIISHPDEAPVTIHNFGQPIKKVQLERLAKSVDLASQVTQGYSKLLVPHIVIHEAFKTKHFRRSGTSSQPAGLAWNGEPFIEINRQTMEGGGGSAGQSWLEQIVLHEKLHQIDASLNPDRPDFHDYFEYIDFENDGIIDSIVPHSRIHQSRWSPHVLYDSKVVEASRPLRDYGSSNAHEDLAVTSEEVPFGGRADPIRRDAYIGVLQAFIRDYRLKNPGAATGDPAEGIAVPLSRYMQSTIHRLIGEEIMMPAVKYATGPLKLSVQEQAGIFSIFRRSKRRR